MHFDDHCAPPEITQYYTPSTVPVIYPWIFWPDWHPLEDLNPLLLPTPRIYIRDGFGSTWKTYREDYYMNGYIEMDDVPVKRATKMPVLDGEDNLIFERFELEFKLAMSPTKKEYDDDSHQRPVVSPDNPHRPYELRSTLGTKEGPYNNEDSCITFTHSETLTPPRSTTSIIRSYFRIRVPGHTFIKWGPCFHRYFEFEARAWFYSEVYTKFGDKPILAMSMAKDTFRAYMAPYKAYHICDYDSEGHHNAPFAPHRFRNLPLLCPIPNVLPRD